MKIWIALLLFVASAAQAQTVWRCGPDGRSYSDAPCRDGRAVDVTQARPAADLIGAQAMAQREKALAARLALESQQRATVTSTGLSGIRDSRQADAAALKPKARAQAKEKAKAKAKRRLEDADTFRAIAPASQRDRD